MTTTDLRNLLHRLERDESGSNALEYGLIIGFVSIAIITGATAAGTALNAMFNAIGTKVAGISTTITG
jgi:pilus assembly protein Flp/PilA